MKTPYYKTDLSKIKENYLIMKDIFQGAEVFYATKPNAENKVFDTLAKVGASFEIVSDKELDYLIKIGVPSSKIICSLPVKPKWFIKKLYKSGCNYFVFDDIAEFKKLMTYAPNSKKILRLSVHEITSTDIEWGMTLEQAISMIKSDEIAQFIDGFTFYILDIVEKEKILYLLLERIETLIKLVNRKGLIINIGGNYPLKSQNNYNFYNKLLKEIDEIKKRTGAIFIVEPGRAIVANTTSLFTTVLLKKGNDIFIDASSQIVKLLPKNIINHNTINENKAIKYTFYENLCSHYRLFEVVLNDNIEEGDLLEFTNYGAYSICFASRFHCTGVPEQIYINDKTD